MPAVPPFISSPRCPKCSGQQTATKDRIVTGKPAMFTCAQCGTGFLRSLDWRALIEPGTEVENNAEQHEPEERVRKGFTLHQPPGTPEPAKNKPKEKEVFKGLAAIDPQESIRLLLRGLETYGHHHKPGKRDKNCPVCTTIRRAVAK